MQDLFKEALGAVVMLVVILVAVGYMSVAAPTQLATADNESFTVDVGNYVALDEDDLVEDSETVWNSSGTEMVKDTDYEIDYENGSIKALSGGDLTDGSNASVSYDFEQRDPLVTNFIPSIASVVSGLGKFVVVMMFLGGAMAYVYRFGIPGSSNGRSGGRR